MARAAADPVSDEHRVFTFTLERIVFFSDAVFAIAITLLSIDLRLPDLPPGQSDASFLAALGGLVPSFGAFILSFIVIAAYWIGHYRTMRYVTDPDGRFVAINFAFLFCIVLMPFATSIIATEGDLASGAIVYASLGVATGLTSTLLWVYPARIAHLVVPAVTPSIARYVTDRLAVVPIVFALSIPAALINPRLAWLLWFAAAPIQAIVTRRHRTGGRLGLGRLRPSP